MICKVFQAAPSVYLGKEIIKMNVVYLLFVFMFLKAFTYKEYIVRGGVLPRAIFLILSVTTAIPLFRVNPLMITTLHGDNTMQAKANPTNLTCKLSDQYLDSTLNELLTARKAYKARYKTLLHISESLEEDGIAQFIFNNFALVTGFSLSRPAVVPLAYSANSATRAGGIRLINTFDKFALSVINFIETNYVAIGNDLSTLIKSLYAINTIANLHFDYDYYIDQTVPNEFRIISNQKQPIHLYTWVQYPDGYRIKRGVKCTSTIQM